MSVFTHFDGPPDNFEPEAAPPPKRPHRLSVSNWPVRWKVLAIVLVPLVLAGVFGGLRIYSSVTEATDLRRAADRTEMVPAIVNYMAALDGAMLASSTGGDPQAALTEFDSSKRELQRRLSDTEIAADVNKGVTSMIADGQALMDKVTSNSITLFERITTYAPILLSAEDAINGSVRVDDERITAETLGLSRAVGARGQMTMQQLLVNLGDELPEPELRTRMIALAGTEPSTLSGISQVLGVGSAEAQRLQGEMVKRLAIMSDPAAVLVNNPDLRASEALTDQIAGKVITDTTESVTSTVDQRAAAQRSAAIRDAAVVGGAMLLALIVVVVVARSLVRPLRRLRDSALRVAHDDLAREIEEVRAGGDPGPIEHIPVHTSDEVGQVAHAVDELHEQAVLLAGEQSRLQFQVGDMFETLSRRSRSLVDQQLSLIDRLERNEEDPERLESLFRLDHLAARMRRNGANLLVLAGAKVPRDQAEPVPVSAIINAAASEVEDYTRVITATVPDSDVAGSVAGDLVHLLAELLDNALRNSPPMSQVRVSAVHTGNGGLVIEVSDIGIGMTDSDLRVANTRLQSGGEVDPYTARHMGLFVVGRLASHHGLVVRLRSTIAGEPNSGTTAGVHVPIELLGGADAHHQFGEPVYRAPEHDREDTWDDYEEVPEAQYRNGHSDVPIALLPQRDPGASGISDLPASLGPSAAPQPDQAADEWPADDWPEDSMPAQAARPADTSGFFAARQQAAGVPAETVEPQEPQVAPERSVTAGSDDAIYQSMLSEWLVDPNDLANSTDLNWESVWDSGWSAAEAADDTPVEQHTEEGLPMRQPGVRLVPGSAETAGSEGGRHGSGGAHRGTGSGDEVASAAEFGSEKPDAKTPPQRDPEAVRASMSSHFGGVHAGRSHARETRGTDSQ
ncbi:ATP-binding protein [Mycobacterium sp. 2YAF39]|uniref:sensor histidine kinase n=1 Tax=Mycobacterium sp. 2YAF39 TaxID=3233033 RepID=UPI003F981453